MKKIMNLALLIMVSSIMTGCLVIEDSDTPQEDSTQEDSTQEDSTQEDSTQEDSTQEDSTQEDSTQEDSTQEDSTQEDNLTQEEIALQLRRSQLSELEVLLNDVDEIEMRSDYGFRISPYEEGYTIFGQDDSEELVIASKYNTGNIITVGFDLHQFLSINITDGKTQFMENIYKLADVNSDEKVLVDSRLFSNFSTNYNSNIEKLKYGNGKINNLNVLHNHDMAFITAGAIESHNFDGELEVELKKFLSEGKTLVVGTGTHSVGDTSRFKRFMREIDVNIANTKRGSVTEILTDITKEEMIDITYLNQINRVKEIQENNSSENVTAAEMEQISQFYGIRGFGEEEYNELGIKFPYTFSENEPYTRAIIYGRARINDLSPGQSKDTSVFYDGRVSEAGDLTDVIVCADQNVANCNNQVKETITLNSIVDKKTVGGGFVQPTGLYLAPGVDATITVNVKDDSMKSKVEYTDLIDFLVSREYGGISITSAEFKRPPGYRKTGKFTVGEYTISSPVGGAIYLEVLQQIKGLEVDVTIDGAVKMAMFELGKTTIAEFTQQLDDYNVDKVIILSDVNMISTTRLNAVQYLNNGSLLKSLDEMDEIYENNLDLKLGYEKTGLYTKPSDGHRVWWQEDVQIKAGWMLSGYPIHTYSRYGLLNDVRSDTGNERRWAEAHELGHNTQYHIVGFDGTVEVTVNINSLYQEYMRGEAFKTYSTTRDDFTGLVKFFENGELKTWGDKAINTDGTEVIGDKWLAFYTQMTIGYYHEKGSVEGTMFDFYKEISRNEIYYNSQPGNIIKYINARNNSLNLPETISITNTYEHMYLEASVLYGFDVYDMLAKYGATSKISTELRTAIKDNFPKYKKITTPDGSLWLHQMVPAKAPGEIPFEYIKELQTITLV